MARYTYYTHYPQQYQADPDTRWPLIVTLHGSWERNIPLRFHRYFRYNRATFALTSVRYPALVAVPLCPPRQEWEPRAVSELVEELLSRERIDAGRIYLQGYSMGGYGVWHTAAAYPDRFAAIAPVCGGGNPADAPALRHVPTWAFHGARDPVVPVQETQRMIEAIVALGGSPRVTIYPNDMHAVWDKVFADPELYAWFWRQQRVT